MARSAVATAVLLAVLVAGAAPAGAKPYAVTKTSDSYDGACTSSDCSLREAVGAANGDTEPDEIVVGEGTYVLDRAPGGMDGNAGGGLEITQPASIRGAGADRTVVRLVGQDTVVVARGADDDVGLADLTLTGGDPPGGGQGGGVSTLSVANTLTLDRVVIRGNRAAVVGDDGGQGGGIYKYAGELVVRDSAVLGNAAPNGGAGGGIFVGSGGVLADLTNVTIAGNAAVVGGGLYVSDPETVVLEHVTVADNTGGGIAGDLQQTLLLSSIVAGNGAADCAFGCRCRTAGTSSARAARPAATTRSPRTRCWRR